MKEIYKTNQSGIILAFFINEYMDVFSLKKIETLKGGVREEDVF